MKQFLRNLWFKGYHFPVFKRTKVIKCIKIRATEWINLKKKISQKLSVQKLKSQLFKRFYAKECEKVQHFKYSISQETTSPVIHVSERKEERGGIVE